MVTSAVSVLGPYGAVHGGFVRCNLLFDPQDALVKTVAFKKTFSGMNQYNG